MILDILLERKKRVKYYTKEVKDVLKEFNTSEDGLTELEASKRLTENGRNELPKAKHDSVLKLFFDQFKNPIELLLFFRLLQMKLLMQ